MTGHGEAAVQSELGHCRAEIRTVNNRHFKLALRCPDGFQQLEAEFERVVRDTISRGTVYLSVRVEQAAAVTGPRLNEEVLKTYWRQLDHICRELSAPSPDPTRLLELPGVLKDGFSDSQVVESLWPMIEQTVRAATTHLQEFRRKEGEATAGELRQLCRAVEEILVRVVALAPQVAREYHEKILQRTRDLLSGSDVRLEPADVLREVALFADRCDIHEEITRLKSHIHQFLTLVESGTSAGRKLDFLCQEMFREANTIGSKANHIGLSHSAVEMKANIERIREIVQNVE